MSTAFKGNWYNLVFSKDYFSHLMYTNIHKITNLWKFWLHIVMSSKLQENNARKTPLLLFNLCAFRCLETLEETRPGTVCAHTEHSEHLSFAHCRKLRRDKNNYVRLQKEINLALFTIRKINLTSPRISTYRTSHFWRKQILFFMHDQNLTLRHTHIIIKTENKTHLNKQPKFIDFLSK